MSLANSNYYARKRAIKSGYFNTTILGGRVFSSHGSLEMRRERLYRCMDLGTRYGVHHKHNYVRDYKFGTKLHYKIKCVSTYAVNTFYIATCWSWLLQWIIFNIMAVPYSFAKGTTYTAITWSNRHLRFSVGSSHPQDFVHGSNSPSKRWAFLFLWNETNCPADVL